VPWIWIIIIVLLSAFIIAVRELPWWGVVLLVGGIIAGAPYVGRLILFFYVRKVGREMASALHSATIEVIEIRAVPPPSAEELKKYEEEKDDPEEEDDEEAGADLGGFDEQPEARHWYELNVVITPASRQEDSSYWQPDSLMMVPPKMPRGEISDACYIAKVDIIEPDRKVPRQGQTCFDPTQLRLLLGVKPGTTRLVFRYMFIEEFGEVIELPAPV
jgi:hypothetical protein